MGMLDGIRVLDFTTNAAGPVAAAILTDYGAEVIKVERPITGDDCRGFAPLTADGKSLSHCWFNRGKSSVTVDLKDPEGIEFIKRMIPSVNVIIESFRPGIMKQFGLDYESVVSLRPDIIYVSVSAFGQTGPYAKRPGYDIIAQAMSGIMSVTGEADGPPMKSGFVLGDLVGALNAFAATMTALYHWKATGVGQYVDVSLVHSLVYLNSTLERCNVGEMAMRQGNHHPTLAPYGLFNGKNGQSIIIACVANRLFASLCDLMGKPELKDDPRFVTLKERCKHQKELIVYIEDWLKNFDNIEDAAKLLTDAGIPCCKVYNNRDVIADEHFRSNGWLVEAPVADDVSSLKTYITRGPNARFSKEPGRIHKAPTLGEHNYEIMETYGYSKEEIERLQAKWAENVRRKE